MRCLTITCARALMMLALAGSAYAAEGELAKLEPVSSTEALGGRLVLMLPAGAKDEARQQSIMSAPESSDDESRLVIDAGEERMVVMVWELFAFAPDDLTAGAKAELGNEAEGREIATFAVADPKLRAVRARPAKPALAGDAALVDACYVALADGTVVYVAAYASSKAFEHLAEAQSLAAKIIASAKGGPRSLARQAGARALGDLTLTAPQDVALSVQQGPDFFVYLLRKLRKLGSPPPATMGVYVGQHPELIHNQGDYAAVAVAKVKGTLFGREVEWDSWTTPAGVHTAEVIEPINRDNADTLVHVFVTAPDGEGVDAMRQVAETLALSK